jgi:hypothetical protein
VWDRVQAGTASSGTWLARPRHVVSVLRAASLQEDVMEIERFLERLVPEIAHNASIVSVDERGDLIRVTIAGTTGLQSGIDVPRSAVEAAAERPDARASLEAALKACADRVVAPVPDGRE